MFLWFSEEEVEGMSPKFVDRLDRARGYAGVPFRITSGFRTPEENFGKGGASDSAHTRGMGADIGHDGDPIKSARIAYGLGRVGIIRVGFYDRHLHADVDESLPQTQWEGKSK